MRKKYFDGKGRGKGRLAQRVLFKPHLVLYLNASLNVDFQEDDLFVLWVLNAQIPLLHSGH